MRGIGHARRRLVGLVGAAAATLVTSAVFAAPAHAAGLDANGDSASVGLASQVAQTNVLSNDTAPDGSPLSPADVVLSVVLQPEAGELFLDGNGFATYTPAACSPGQFVAVYMAEMPAENLVAAAAVTFQVTAGGTPVQAGEDAATVDANGMASGDLLANDCGITTPATLENTIINTHPVSGPTSGTVTINFDGTFTYQAGPDFAGTDSFSYRIHNAVNPTRTSVATVTLTSA